MLVMLEVFTFLNLSSRLHLPNGNFCSLRFKTQCADLEALV